MCRDCLLRFKKKASILSNHFKMHGGEIHSSAQHKIEWCSWFVVSIWTYCFTLSSHTYSVFSLQKLAVTCPCPFYFKFILTRPSEYSKCFCLNPYYHMIYNKWVIVETILSKNWARPINISKVILQFSDSLNCTACAE